MGSDAQMLLHAGGAGRSTLRRFAGSLALLALVATLLAALPAEGAEETDAEEGAHLYRRDCASCHGPEGEGSRRGPSLEEAGEADNVYYLHTGRMPILSPEDPVRRKPVPYTDEQLAELVVYASGLGDGPPLPDISMDGAEPPSGGVDYRLHCAVCHGAPGQGGPLTGGDNAPSLHRATPIEVVAAMTAGPGSMPSFAQVLTPASMANVASYVSHLQEPDGVAVSVPGGRVAESLIGMVVAGLLIVVGRLIGETE